MAVSTDTGAAFGTGSHASTEPANGLGPSGFDPSRVMQLFAAVTNARFALEYWDREARWGSGTHDGNTPTWAVGAAQRGAHECDVLRATETFLRSMITPRDTDGSPKGTDAQRQDGEAATAGAEGIAKDAAA